MVLLRITQRVFHGILTCVSRNPVPLATYNMYITQWYVSLNRNMVDLLGPKLLLQWPFYPR